MALSTSIRIAAGLGIAALALVGFAAASGQLSPSKSPANGTSPTNQITSQTGDQDDRDDRGESRTETRVIDTKTGQVLIEDIRRTEDRSRHEIREEDADERDDDHGGHDHD